MGLSDQVYTRFISLLISCISRVLQQLLKYLNDTTISTFSALVSSGDFPVILTLNMSDSESLIGSFGSSFAKL